MNIDGHDKELWFEFDLPPDEQPDDRLQEANRPHYGPFLVATTFLAMQHGQDIHISGSVPGVLIRNVEKASRIWSSWLPRLYQPIRITADRVTHDQPPSRPPPRHALLAYSGGVDSAYSALASASQLDPGIDSLDALLVHGMDIPLANASGFRDALLAQRPMLEQRGVRLWSAATNYREVFSEVSWEYSYMTCLVAIMSVVSMGRRRLIVSADGSYPNMVTRGPWAQNLITDALWVEWPEMLEIVGLLESRREKLTALRDAGWDMASLRVCWKHGLAHNCGDCEKCLRNMLLYETLGLDPVPTFGRRPTAWAILRRVRIKSRVHLSAWQKVYHTLSRRQVLYRLALKLRLIKYHLRRLVRR
ncbi:MAG: hypothetical protein JJU36_16890 [Phycisphaeraceae bacterium]|nr:hypothetical protein [Phycisphaeraceae bacterium]